MASICVKATTDRREALDVATSPPRLESSLLPSPGARASAGECAVRVETVQRSRHSLPVYVSFTGDIQVLRARCVRHSIPPLATLFTSGRRCAGRSQRLDGSSRPVGWATLSAAQPSGPEVRFLVVGRRRDLLAMAPAGRKAHHVFGAGARRPSPPGRSRAPQTPASPSRRRSSPHPA